MTESIGVYNGWIICDDDGTPIARNGDVLPLMYDKRHQAADVLSDVKKSFRGSKIIRVSIDIGVKPRQQRKINNMRDNNENQQQL